MAYGQKFKEIRRSNLLSQEEFAKQVGVSRSVISQIEIDKIKPTLDALTTISKLFDVSLEYLMLDEEPLPEKDKLNYNNLFRDNILHKKQMVNEYMPFSNQKTIFDNKVGNRIQQIPYFSLFDSRHLGFRFSSEEMRSKLPYLQIPIDYSGTLMAFEVPDSGKHQTEILICQLTDLNAIYAQQFVVMVTTNGLLHGIIEKITENKLTLNNEHLHLHEIREVFVVRLVIGQPEMHNNLKAQLKKMEVLLKDLKKKG